MSAEVSASDAVLFRDAGGQTLPELRPTPVVVVPVERRRAAVRESATRRLVLPQVGESLPSRLGWMAVASAIALLYFLALYCYWAPAHPGVDQNGYFVGGRSFASTLSSGLKPASDYGFVGRMYILEPESGINYPKYPLGLPILFAACLKLFGEARGVAYAHLISPISAALATLGVFAITRRLAGGFIGVMAMLLLACGQVMLTLAVNPNSHAAGTCAVVWGTFFLLRWLESGAAWRGVLAGALYGLAYTIRYTDGLLLLPLGVALLYATCWQRPTARRAAILLAVPVALGLVWLTCVGGFEVVARLALATSWRIFAVPTEWGLGLIEALRDFPSRWHWMRPFAENDRRALQYGVAGVAVTLSLDVYAQRRSLWRLWLVRLAWLVPVAYLTIFNVVEMHAFTSYAGTNESTGFTMDYFFANWEKMVRVMNDQGLFFIAPLGLLGLICMFRRLPIVAAILTLWFLPSVLLYTAYYWAPDNMGVSYSRFVLTQLPALVIAAAWLLGEVGQRVVHANARVGRRLNLIVDPSGRFPAWAAVLLVAVVGAVWTVGVGHGAAWFFGDDVPTLALRIATFVAAAVGLGFIASVADVWLRRGGQSNQTATLGVTPRSFATYVAFASLLIAGTAATVAALQQFDVRRDGLWWALVVPGAAVAIAALAALPSVGSARWASAFDRHFSRTTTRLAIAGVVFVSCSLGLYRTVKGSEWGQPLNIRANIEIQSRQNNNLAGLGVEVRRAVGWPAKDRSGKVVGPTDASVLMFADGERLHHLQWIGGWQLFDVNAFNAERVNRMLWRQAESDTDPDPIDPARVKFLRELYKGKDQRALQGAENDLMATALASGKRVVYVLNDATAKQFAKQIDQKRFTVKPLGTYNDVPPPRTSDELLPAGEKPKEPVNRFGRGNAFNNQNLFAGPREFMRIGEVTLKPPPASAPPATQPATQPSTQPGTRPAT